MPHVTAAVLAVVEGKRKTWVGGVGKYVVVVGVANIYLRVGGDN